MTVLEQLERTPVPRPSDLCRRLARTIDAPIGFVLYGMLWFFASCVSASVLLFIGIAIVGDDPGPVAKALVMGMWVSGFVGAWVLFALWVRRRIGPARRLFREGTLDDASVESVRHMRLRGAPFTLATLVLRGGAHRIELSIGGHPPQVAEGVAIPVLFVADYGYCATFPIDGKVTTASIKRA